jgi:hypothetical protein
MAAVGHGASVWFPSLNGRGEMRFTFFTLLLKRGVSHAELQEIREVSSEIHRLYVGGIVGRDHDHRHLDRLAIAGGASRPRSGTKGAMCKPTQTNWAGVFES